MEDESSDISTEDDLGIKSAGDFNADRDAWVGNSFRAHTQNFNLTGDLANLPADFQRRLLPHKDLFATGTPDQRRAAALNLLYYDGFNSKREQLSLSVTSVESYAWIENTEFPRWLTRQDDKSCWIFGKPGSGKSTLMKYLADNKSTRERLQSAGKDKKWYVVHFFFDYRGGSDYKNNIKGLLRLFLSQIITQIPSVADRLSNLFRGPNECSIDLYSDELCQVIVNESIHMCAFVDGLDEYEGDLWDMYVLIDDLCRKAGAKFCLANRPESSLRTISARLAGTEIFVHNNNQSAIKACIDFKLDKLQLIHRRLADCISTELRWKVVKRAQGVILWASLAIDDVVKEFMACNNPSSMNFEEILDSLPSGLETLYDRILDKISPDMAGKAALVLYLLSQYEIGVAEAVYSIIPQDCPFEVLLQACSFIQNICPEISGSHGKNDITLDESNIRAFVGDLIDIIDYPGGQTDYYRIMIEPDPRCKTRDVRLIHKSLSRYITKSYWIEANLRSSVKYSFPNSTWRRLGLYIMTDYPQMNEFSKFISGKLQPLLHANSCVPNRLSTVFQESSLAHRENGVIWGSWKSHSVLCKFCSWSFPDFAHDHITGDRGIVDEFSFPSEPQWPSLIHLFNCPDCHCTVFAKGLLLSIRFLRLYSQGYVDLFCTLLHLDLPGLKRKLFLLTKEKRVSVVASLYDILLFELTARCRLSFERSSKIMVELANLLTDCGARFERRHLCGMVYWNGYNLLEGAKAGARSIQQTGDLHKDHDPDCTFKHDDRRVLNHWVGITGSWDTKDMLSAALTLIKPDANYDFKGDGNIFHAILDIFPQTFEDFFTSPVSPYCGDMCTKVIIAAEHFAPFRTPSKHGLASAYAKKLQRRCQFSISAFTSNKRKDELRMLKLAENALSEAEALGVWGPNLALFAQRWEELKARDPR